MAVHLDHIGVPARDKKASAEFLAGILGLEAGAEFGPFIPVKVANGVTLDYVDSDDFRSHHCAFLVSDEEFDAILARIQEAGITHYADPGPRRVGEINHRYGGRGFYFDDPNGHAFLCGAVCGVGVEVRDRLEFVFGEFHSVSAYSKSDGTEVRRGYPSSAQGSPTERVRLTSDVGFYGLPLGAVHVRGSLEGVDLRPKLGRALAGAVFRKR